jgi:diguanylate cyclase (GGDEF)-like protein
MPKFLPAAPRDPPQAIFLPGIPADGRPRARATIRAVQIFRPCLIALALLPLWVTAAIAADAPPAHPAADLVKRADHARRANLEEARRLADEALALIAAQPDADLEIRARLVLCEYYSENDLERARQMLARATTQLPLARRGGLRAGVHSCAGEIDESAGDFERALSAYERAVSAAEVAADDEFLANALYQRGWLRGVQGEYALGLADMRRSLALYERSHMPEHSRTAVNGVASIYNRMGDYAQAQRYFGQAAKAQLATGQEREAVVSLYNLGRTHENLGQWAEAQRVHAQALEIGRRIGYARGQAYAERGLAAVHNARGEWKQALERLALAERAAGDLPDARLRAHLALARGVALRGLRRPAESVVALNAALATFAKADSIADMAATYAALAAAQADLADFRAAYESQRLLRSVTDRLHAQQLDQRFLTLKVEFDTAAREKENALLAREKAAAEATLQQAQRAGRLQVVAIALAAALAVVLGVLAWRHRKLSRTMHALAMTDELTGLPNRRAVLARLAALLDDGSRCAALIVDLDHFKAINDRHGHLVGDEVLRAVSAVLVGELHGDMSAGRLGGEEFLLLLPGADLDRALREAERVRAAVGRIDTTRWFSDPPLSVSVGVAIAHPGPGGVADVLRRADEALYAAKAAGRDRVRGGTPAAAA